MDFPKIISRAWDLIKKRRYLWWLGVLAAFSEGGLGGNGLSSVIQTFNRSDLPKNPVPNSSSQGPIIDNLSHIFTESTSKNFNPVLLQRILEQIWPYLIVFFGLSFLILILIIYLSNSSRAGLIISVNDLENDKNDNGPTNFISTFHKGTPYAWRLFVLDFLIGCIVFLSILIIFAPLIFSVIFQAGITAYILTAIFAFIGLLAIIVSIFYLSLVVRFASRALVLEDINVAKSISQSRQLIHNHLQNGLMSLLINIVINIVVSAVFVFVTLIICALLFGLGFAIHSISNEVATIIYAVITGVIVLISLWVISGIYTSFNSSYWTIIYRAINYIDKKNKILKGGL